MAGTVEQLDLTPTTRPEPMSVDRARKLCRDLARRHYENFPVLSSLIPRELRDDFAAVYAFCRLADDLGDETGNRDASRDLLARWREELKDCFAGSPRHPVFISLRSTIERHELPIEPFDNLIRAFEQDQSIDRYDTWDQLIDYCRLSANPVGQLVLMICGETMTDEKISRSDDICTALQLTNHWQDVSRDILQRNRVYIPRDMIDVEDIDSRLAASAKQGFGIDQKFLGESRQIVKQCVEKTWPYFERGSTLLSLLKPTTKPIVWLFLAGGRHVLHDIELWNYETALFRPQLGIITRSMLIVRAWMKFRLAMRTQDGRK